MRLVDIINANRKLHDRFDFRGLKISIENRAGSIRKGTDKNGKPWKTKMTVPYGYIRMTEGVDGDHVDCFIGPNVNAENVYIIHRQDPDTKRYDEDKVMLGFISKQSAIETFNDNYDRIGNVGGVTVMKFDDFKKKVLSTKDKPRKLAAGGPGSGRKKSTFSKEEEKHLDQYGPNKHLYWKGPEKRNFLLGPNQAQHAHISLDEYLFRLEKLKNPGGWIDDKLSEGKLRHLAGLDW